MATLCGWASIDERGSARGGSAGDQNGREVKTGNWYDFGQKIVLRFKDRSKAKKAAQTMKTLCNGNYVGYDQNQRTTLYTEMQKVGWDASKLKTKCETDCSAMMSPVLRSAGISVSKDIYTGNMVAAIMGTGQFTKLTASKYTDSGDYLLTGDIMVNEGSHTIMALEDGAKAGGESSGSSSSGSSSSGASSGGALNKTPKWTGKVTADVLNVRTWAGEENAKLTSYPQIKNGAEVGVCAEVKDGDGDIWYYIQINGSKGQKYGFVHSAYIAKTSGGSAASSGGSHEKGDTVQFTGSRHYVSSDDTGAGSKATPCTAKITNKKDGALHPYHLQGSGVYGWVNAADIKEGGKSDDVLHGTGI